MVLERDKSSTTVNCTLRVTVPTWTGSTTSLREVVEAQLNLNKIHHGFSRLEGTSPICLITDTCKRSVELQGSTKIRLTLKSQIPRDRIRAFQCGCNIHTGSTKGKMIVPSIGWALSLVNSSRMELTRSQTEAACNSLCFFRLKLYSSSWGPP